MATLYLWGKPINHTLHQTAGSTQQMSIDNKVKKVSCGDRHCIVMCQNIVYGIGDNCQGQLGDDQNKTSGLELGIIQLSRNIQIKDVSCGWEHTLLLDEFGQVYSSGRGDQGQLGRGRTSNSFCFQVVIRGAKQISAGKDHSLAICGSKVMGWGNSREGQLGLLIKKIYFRPQQLNVYPCHIIYAGPKYSLFVTTKGVFGCGANQLCQLGLGHETDAFVPRKLSIEESIVTVTGGNYCAAGTAEGQWYLWGSGGFGVFKFPTKMSFLKGADSISMGLNFGVLIRSGQVNVWGCNRWGELGIREQSKDYACEAEQLTKLNLQNIVCGGNFMVGFCNNQPHNQKSYQEAVSRLVDSQQNQQILHHSRNQPSESKHSSQWQEYYQMKEYQDRIKGTKRRLFADQYQNVQEKLTKGIVGATCYETWQIRNSPKKIVNLTSSMKKLTNPQLSLLEKQNNHLRKELNQERSEKQQLRQEYIEMMSITHDNKVLNQLYHKGGYLNRRQSPHQPSTHDLDGLNKKLNSLKSLLQSVYD